MRCVLSSCPGSNSLNMTHFDALKHIKYHAAVKNLDVLLERKVKKPLDYIVKPCYDYNTELISRIRIASILSLASENHYFLNS